MTHPCAHCGADFPSRSSRARYCGDKCRAAAGHLRRSGVSLPTLSLATVTDLEPGDGTLTSVTLRDVRALGVEHTTTATLALIVSRTIDAGQHTGSGLTALSREYSRVMAEITAAAATPATDTLDDLRKARASRRANLRPMTATSPGKGTK